jgi:hypothetical protein
MYETGGSQQATSAWKGDIPGASAQRGGPIAHSNRLDGLLTLYQMRLIEYVPEPLLPGLDAEKVDASAQAYAYFATPDGVLGIGSYAATPRIGGDGRR